MDEITVRQYGEDQHEVTISDYYGPGTPLVFDLNEDQAAQLRERLRPKRTGAVTPAKLAARMRPPIMRYAAGTR